MSNPPSSSSLRSLATRLAVSFLVAVAPCVASAQDKNLGTFKAWHALTFTENGQRVCMMWSQPTKSEGDYKRRGETFVFVTHRPGDRERNKVSIEIGYTFDKEAKASIAIERSRFGLFTDDSTAWPLDDTEHEALVKAMRAGRTMRVEGTSNRGTHTRDTYSLLGFSAAHNAITKACKIK